MKTDTLPDYKLAARELAELFAKLPVKTEIANGRAGLDKAESKDGRDWAHYACEVVYRDATSGKELARLPYKMGTGLIDWKAVCTDWKTTSAEAQNFIQHMQRGSSRLTAETQSRAVGYALSAFAKAVKPAEVLASYARDAQDASGQSFEEWCANYGSDTDSRKALETYLACQAGESKVRAVIGCVCSVSQLAELASRL